MKIAHNIAKAASPVKVRFDRVKRAHIRVNGQTAGRAARLRKFQRALLYNKIEFQDTETKVAAYLIAFDGVATLSDLTDSLDNLKSMYHWRGNLCLEWEDKEKRTNRRFLSIFTRRALAFPCDGSYFSSSILEKLEATLGKFYPSTVTCCLEQLLHDAQAYLFEALPGPLFSHCSSIIPLTAVPRKVLARDAAQKALNASFEKGNENSRAGLAYALDGYFSPRSKSDGAWLIHQLVVDCHEKKSVADDIDKRRMLKACLLLAAKAQSAGQAASLVLAWAIDFIESGTSTKSNVSPRTIDMYIGIAALPLSRAFKSIELEEAEPCEYLSLYESLIKSVAAGSQKTMRSALSSWHNFLVRWVGAPVLEEPLGGNVEAAVPNANVIWQHEIALITTWLESATCDQRLLSQVRVAFAIAVHARIRASELFKLRIKNIRIWDGNLEIEISPMRRDGRLKSSSSRRVMLIDDSEAKEIIIEWVKRRKLEGALMEDLLFADPYSPSYGYKPGQMYVMINTLLKAASGDDDVSFHTLSHTLISQRMENALIAEHTADINMLDIVAAEVGHVSSQTGLLHYFHFFERLIRHFLDKSIQTIPLTSLKVSELSSLSSEAYRQRCSRNKKSSGKEKMAIAWEAITESLPVLLVPEVKSTCELADAEPPSVIHKPNLATYKDCMDVLSGLAEGLPVSAISSRSNLPEEEIGSLARSACRLLEQLGLLEKSFHEYSCEKAVSDFQLGVNNPSANAIKFDRVWHPKLDSLREFLLGSAKMEVLRAGLQSWGSCFQKGYLSLVRPSQAAGLVNLLKAAEISVDRLLVCASFSNSANDNQERVLLSQVCSLFTSVYPIQPKFDLKKPRRGRPKTFLVLSGVDLEVNEEMPSAAASMGGLNALLFAAYLFYCLPGPFNPVKTMEV